MSALKISMRGLPGEADKNVLQRKKGQINLMFEQQQERSKRQIEIFQHTIMGSLFRQPMKYQITTCESVVVGNRDDTVLG